MVAPVQSEQMFTRHCQTRKSGRKCSFNCNEHDRFWCTTTEVSGRTPLSSITADNFWQRLILQANLQNALQRGVWKAVLCFYHFSGSEDLSTSLCCCVQEMSSPSRPSILGPGSTRYTLLLKGSVTTNAFLNYEPCLLIWESLTFIYLHTGQTVLFQSWGLMILW